ncbi:hypothetical protein [Streptomyces iconiensis]|uniref:Uncharacterized protein n=1 Tax=Streptomyces iconiensis TaxID=1384038 RepID=A0ABT6ZNC9_9ACTN|nr:hypothetical protein [Streptomyces iconiensis]MDJ1130562.1 hypothetical protein [Streptomyces iconiensis]
MTRVLAHAKGSASSSYTVKSEDTLGSTALLAVLTALQDNSGLVGGLPDGLEPAVGAKNAGPGTFGPRVTTH